MIFEKMIRKKEIPVFYLEIWGYVLFIQAFFIVASIIVGLCFHSFFITMVFYLFGIVMTVVFFLLSTFSKSTLLHNFVLPFRLLQDRRYQRINVLDEVVVDCFLSFIEEYRTEDGFISSYTYAFFTEPFIFVAEFVTLPTDAKAIFKSPLHIYLQKVHWSYRLHKAYKKKKEDWENELEQELLISDEGIRKYEKRNSDLFYLYITYDKSKVLNRLFELVNPPEFRITTYEKSGVFISIDPIPGKEYPPEALECMEKINAMYP